MKWYEHQLDMRRFSSKFPNVLFVLSGEGEENDDMWVEYYRNGLMQVARAQITFDDFDEDKLN